MLKAILEVLYAGQGVGVGWVRDCNRGVRGFVSVCSYHGRSFSFFFTGCVRGRGWKLISDRADI